MYALRVEVKVGFPHCSLHPCSRMYASGYSQPVNVPGQCFQPLVVLGSLDAMECRCGLTAGMPNLLGPITGG